VIESVYAALPLGRPKARTLQALAVELHLSPWKLREVLAVLMSEGRVVLSRLRYGRTEYRNVYWRNEKLSNYGPADRSAGEKEWLPIETMPIGRSVLVRTTTGRERLARRLDYARVKHRPRGASISCHSIEPRGDVTAVGWRDAEK
jgi:hypothetical protein